MPSLYWKDAKVKPFTTPAYGDPDFWPPKFPASGLNPEKTLGENGSAADYVYTISTAMAAGNFSTTARLLDNIPTTTGNFKSLLQTILFLALEYRQHAILAMLLRDHRFDINMEDSRGRTALHFAVIYDDPIALDILMAHEDVRLNHTDSAGDSALLLGAKTFDGGLDRKQILNTLISRPDIMLNQRDCRGRSAIWHAANTRNIDLIRKLGLVPGIEFGAADDDGITPQARARQQEDFTIARLLEDLRSQKMMQEIAKNVTADRLWKR